MLQFKDVSTQEGTLETIGTVATFVGAGGRHQLASAKNFKGSIKDNGKLTNVTLALFNAAGQREFVNCSGPVSADLRTSTSESELKAKLIALANYPILKLPQFDADENPIMVQDEETGEQVQLTIYSVSFPSGADMSVTAVTITPAMLKLEAVKRTIDWNDLVAL
jgi:hypothetical protein